MILRYFQVSQLHEQSITHYATLLNVTEQKDMIVNYPKFNSPHLMQSSHDLYDQIIHFKSSDWGWKPDVELDLWNALIDHLKVGTQAIQNGVSIPLRPATKQALCLSIVQGQVLEIEQDIQFAMLVGQILGKSVFSKSATLDEDDIPASVIKPVLDKANAELMLEDKKLNLKV